MKSTTKIILCSKCGRPISKYHAVHKRVVQNLPFFQEKEHSFMSDGTLWEASNAF